MHPGEWFMCFACALNWKNHIYYIPRQKKKKTFSALSINIETLFFQHSSVHSGLIFSSRVLIVECLNWLIRIQYKVYAALLFNKCFGLLKKGLHWNSCWSTFSTQFASCACCACLSWIPYRLWLLAWSLSKAELVLYTRFSVLGLLFYGHLGTLNISSPYTNLRSGELHWAMRSTPKAVDFVKWA